MPCCLLGPVVDATRSSVFVYVAGDQRMQTGAEIDLVQFELVAASLANGIGFS